MHDNSLVLLQEEEYRLRQYGEVDRRRSGEQDAELEGLQGQQHFGSSLDMPDLAGRQGTLGTGYFDAAGNWQTYDAAATANDALDSRYDIACLSEPMTLGS